MNLRNFKIIQAAFLAAFCTGAFAGPAADIASGAKTHTVPLKKARPAAESVRVRNIELIEKKGGVIVRVHLSDKAEFTHQIEPAKGGKPYRIILDCQDAIHYLGANRFMTLPNTVIKSIRTSQYSVTPKRISRIVLDLKREAFYKVKAVDRHIDLFVTDVSVKPFDSWSTSSFLAAKKAKSAAAKTLAQTTPVKPVQTKKSTAVAVVEVKSPKKAVARSGAKKAVKKMTPSPAKAKANLAQAAPAKSDSKEFVKPKSKVLSNKVSSNRVSSKSPVSVKKSRVVASKPAVKKTVSVAVTTPNVKVVTKKTGEKPVKGIVKSGVSKTSVSPVVARLSKADKKNTTSKNSPGKVTQKKNPVKKSSVKKSYSKKSAAKKISPKLAAVDKKSSKGVKKTPKSTAKKSNKSTKSKAGKAAPNSKSSSSLFASNVQAAIKPQAVRKASADKGYSAKFRRSVDRRAIRLKGTLVAEFPKRLTIKYKSRGTRDPFASLFDRKPDKNRNMLDPRPNVESLTMVGVSRDVDGKTRGLFEDIDGRGYILAKGDRVEHGTVIKITSKKAYFQIFEYGWSRTVSLSLEN